MQERNWTEHVAADAESSTMGELAGQAKQKAAGTLEQVKQQTQAKLDEQKQQAAE